MMIKNERKIYIWVVILLVLLAVVLPVWANSQARIAYAAEATYSNVLDDLEKDSTFNAEDYPAIDDGSAESKTLKLIQIAESTSKELFLYIYNPSANTTPLSAKSVRISTESTTLSYKDYALTRVNEEGVFAKYVVQGLEVKSDGVRIYDIPCLHRDVKDFDDEGAADNDLNAIAVEVAQRWTVVTNGDEVIYKMDTTDVVIIEHQWVGLLRFNDGVAWLYPAAVGKTDVHFVSFKTNYAIDKLFEIDISYLSQARAADGSYGEWDRPALVDGNGHTAEVETVQKTIHADDEDSNPANHPFGTKHKWSCIRTKDDFVAQEDLTAEAKENIKDDQFVVCFATTEWQKVGFGTSYQINYTKISEVTIMRLYFECEGKPYNLGVVSNKQTGDNKPDNNNTNEWNPDIGEWIKNWWEDFLNKNGDLLTRIIKIIAIIAGVVVGLVVLGLFVRLCRFIKRLFGKRKADYKYQYSRKRRK